MPVVKKLLKNSGDTGGMGSIPGWGRSPGRGYGNTLKYSCLGSPVDRGAWRATVDRVTNSQIQVKQLGMQARTYQILEEIHKRREWYLFLKINFQIYNEVF